MKRILLPFLYLTVLVTGFCQGGAVAGTSPIGISPDPSMKETAAWIKRELPRLGSFSIVTVKNNDRSNPGIDQYKIESAVLSDGRLTIRRSESKGKYLRLSYTETVTLKDVDVSKIRVVEAPNSPELTASKPSYLVKLDAATDRGAPFTSQMKQEGFPAGDATPMRWVRVRVSDEEGANRVADVLRRAAILYGAPNPPMETAVAEPAQKAEISPAKPASPANSKMTNDEVVQLVTAGLSEQVVTTSIRQAPTKDFDLTPTGLIALKKAGVSDAVIVVMQERGAIAQAATASEVATPPKYDATLAEPRRPAAEPESRDPCAGIELMGLYKNEVFDRAMGGGIVEWLAKIRNNTSVTKIVVIGWRDMYGQEKTARVQIRGGEIASPRLDLTQARLIQPVTGLRVVSCE